VNLPPLEVDEFERLRAAGIGCYEMMQESYHRETYQTVHVSGPKRDYDYRLATMHRAMEGGIRNVGIGALFGLYDWRYEVLGLVEHARSLEAEFGRGPETIGVPRVEPAPGSDFSLHPAAPVTDAEFLKLIAILRLAVPHAGIVLSTKEAGELRHEAVSIGVTHLQAGRRCEDVNPDPEFQAGDTRELTQVVSELESEGCLLG
jgi:2-iminoacetate synthase